MQHCVPTAFDRAPLRYPTRLSLLAAGERKMRRNAVARRRAPVWERHVDCDAQLFRRMPRPSWIIQDTAGQCDQIGLTAGNDFLSVPRIA